MKAIFAALMMLAVAACGSRRVQVETGAQPTGEVAVSVTNNAGQAVNVYVVQGGTKTFVGQVSAGSTQRLPVAGITSGTVVQLQAVLADGTRTFTRDNVALSASTSWQVP